MENIRHIGRKYGSCKTANTKSTDFSQPNSDGLVTERIVKDTRVSIRTRAYKFSSPAQTHLIDDGNTQECKEWRHRASLNSAVGSIITDNQAPPGTSTIEMDDLIRERNGHIFFKVVQTHIFNIKLQNAKI